MKRNKVVNKSKIGKLKKAVIYKGLNTNELPKLEIEKIAIVSRNYSKPTKESDFSEEFETVLNYCDKLKCDSIIYSLFSVYKENVGKILKSIRKAKFVKTIFLEEFNNRKEVGMFNTYYKDNNSWCKYELIQKFASLSEVNKKKLIAFNNEVVSERLFDNFTVLLCGESNVVRYSQKRKQVEDYYGYLDVLPDKVKIILNPIHDKMTRYEMNLKRKFLSTNERTVISVWNKGKIFKDGKTRDGKNPPWKIFMNGEEILIKGEDHIKLNDSPSEIEIGILDFKKNFAQSSGNRQG